MNTKLGDIAQLQFGFYSKPREGGNAAYLQAKHFDGWGRLSVPIDTTVHIDKKNEAHLLEEGDILLVGKGLRHFAWTYDKAIGPAVASSIFFVIKPDRYQVLPEFLTIIFNFPQTQSYFQTLGAGSSIPSIRKSELSALQVPLPSIQQQKRISILAQLHQKEIDLVQQVITQKQILINAIISKLTK